jgi:hypothetical protein
MKILAALSLLAVSALAIGCKAPGDAWADAVCACTDTACMDKAMKEHESAFPESKAKIGEMDKMPEDKKKQLGRGMECMMKVGMAEEKAKAK